MKSIGYVTDVLQETTLYAEHAGKTELDTEDVRLAIKNQMRHMFVPPPSREVCSFRVLISKKPYLEVLRII